MVDINLLKRLTEIKLKNDNNYICVRGTSMLPLINDGDSVRVECCSSYRSGDIVVAIDSLGRLLVHRVVSFSSKSIIIKGDNAVAVEEVDKEYCIGRVVEIKSYNKIKQIPKGSLKAKLTAILSRRINMHWQRTSDYFKSINCVEHKLINLINK